MRVLVARLDSAGDVLLAGPSVRAVAAQADEVVFLCGRRGSEAAQLLPGVDRIVVRTAEWIEPDPHPIEPDEFAAFISHLTSLSIDEAAILTSFHQSPLPLALALRMAGVGSIAAACADYPGSLLDHRCPAEADIHEVERSLSVVGALGYRLPRDDDAKLAIKLAAQRSALPLPAGPYIVLHPGASVPARAPIPEQMRAIQRALSSVGTNVVVTGGPHECELTRYVAEDHIDLGGRTTLAGLAGIIKGAVALVAGNTGPAHLAAAVGTPVVSLFAPTVPAARWRPWKVPHRILGAQSIECAGCRARSCPKPGHPCIGEIRTADVIEAIESMVPIGAGR